MRVDHIMRVDDFVRVDTIVSQVDLSHSLHWSNTGPLLCDSYTGKALAADFVGWDLFLVCFLFHGLFHLLHKYCTMGV